MNQFKDLAERIENQFSLKEMFRFNEKEFLEFKSKYG